MRRTSSQDTFDFDVVVYDDAGGNPGSLLASVSTTADDIPTASTFFNTDMSAAGLVVPPGRYYIGARYVAGPTTGILICYDTSSATDPVPAFASGNDGQSWFTPAFPGFRAFGIRALFAEPEGIQLSDVAGLIVPGFEVEVDNAEGPTTLFAIRNTTDDTLDVNVDYYGSTVTEEPLRTDALVLGPQETMPQNVRTDLSGLDMEDGFATGLIIVTEAGGSTAPNLQGDYFRVDFGNDFAAGDRLVSPADFCTEQEVRFVDFGSGSQLRILVNRPRGEDVPSVSYTAYGEDGEMVAEGELFTSEHLTVVDVTELLPGEAFGTVLFDFSNSSGGWASARYSAFGRFSLELNAACRDE
ncbi:MAG: hypothetical protein V3T72_16785 [Thermoanaerobaculia bacterium]